LRSMPKLLISVRSSSEVLNALEGGADIIDVKDPAKGSLGLPRISVVREVVRIVNGLKEVSVAIGDVRSNAAELGYVVTALDSFVNYVKIGFALKSVEEAIAIGREVVENVRKSKIVFVSYADYHKHSFIDPITVIDVAIKAGAQGVMIDTFGKEGLSSFDILPRHYLQEFVNKAKKNGFFTAIAGGLNKHHIKDAVTLGFDVIGFRSAVCVGGRNGSVSKQLVAELRNVLNALA